MLARYVDPRVDALYGEFDVEIVPKGRYPKEGQTRAVCSIRRLIDNHGAEHARLVLCVLAEGRGNHALIEESSLMAVSDLLLACPDLVEQGMAAVPEVFDAIPLGAYIAIVNELRGRVHQGHALAGILYVHLRRLRESSLTAKETIRSRMAKADASEAEKGRQGFTKRQRRREDIIALGKRMLAVKAS
ncbi:hypothetical protein NKH99_26095 [Mesorhizobium sp. M0854]|uniref:hypothetical protein n=1 Tax=Mesorhizobium sp. M0854 TaxID=2957013 RepID=UPI00333CAEF5